MKTKIKKWIQSPGIGLHQTRPELVEVCYKSCLLTIKTGIQWSEI